jgi:hypothetical protein
MRANVVRLLGLAAIVARDQCGDGQEMVPAPVALASPADTLLR